MAAARTDKSILADVMKAPTSGVKVAVVDIDGILRGKLLHKDKFASAVEGGFGFCDVVYGWDMHDQCYDNTTTTGWHKGYPDAIARLDLATHRNVPWDGGVDFFLGNFVRMRERPRGPLPARRPPGAEARAVARAATWASSRCARSSSSSSTSPRRRRPGPRRRASAPSRSRRGCSATRCCAPGYAREYFNALFSELAAFDVPIEGLHTETGPGVYEAAIVYSDALEAGDRARAVQGRREGDRRALRHHAELHGQVERSTSPAARATSTRACRTAGRTSSTTPTRRPRGAAA